MVRPTEYLNMLPLLILGLHMDQKNGSTTRTIRATTDRVVLLASLNGSLDSYWVAPWSTYAHLYFGGCKIKFFAGPIFLQSYPQHAVKYSMHITFDILPKMMVSQVEILGVDGKSLNYFLTRSCIKRVHRSFVIVLKSRRGLVHLEWRPTEKIY
jgi:hypothetical protein